MSPAVAAILVSVISIVVNGVAFFVHLYFRASVSSILERLAVHETKLQQLDVQSAHDSAAREAIWERISDLREKVAKLEAVAAKG